MTGQHSCSWRAILIAVLFVFAPALAVSAQDSLESDWSNVADEIRPLVAKAMEENKVTGMSIALVDGDRLVWAEGFGFADAAAGTRATADTMFEIGSISKTVTGLMVMKLAEEGKLDIDRPLTDYIPEFKLGAPMGDFPRSGTAITIRSMMTHHSGIPGDLFNGAFTTEFDPGFSAKLLAWLAGDSATYPPDFRWSYSNTAVALLADVIERVSGRSFAEYSSEFLDSMGMAPASFFKEGPGILAALSKTYADGQEQPLLYVNIPASGSIVASARQMSSYMRMLLGKGSIDGRLIVKPETLEAMLEPQNAGIPLDIGLRIGLSFILSDLELEWAGRLYWHNGATMFSHSHFEVLPGQGLAAFAICNSAGGSQVVEMVAKGLLLSALKLKRGQVPPDTAAASTGIISDASAAGPVPAVIPARILESFAGIYVNNDRGRYEIIEAAPGCLSWTKAASQSAGGRGDPEMLLPFSDGLFRSGKTPGVGFEFREISGRFLMIVHAGNESGIWGDRYTPHSIPESWKSRLGRWVATDTPPEDVRTVLGALSEFTLSIADGMFVMDNEGALSVVDPISGDSAYIRGLGRSSGSQVRVVVENGEELVRFMMTTYRKAEK